MPTCHLLLLATTFRLGLQALSHAERAIILLQRALWAHHMNFQARCQLAAAAVTCAASVSCASRACAARSGCLSC